MFFRYFKNCFVRIFGTHTPIGSGVPSFCSYWKGLQKSPFTFSQKWVVSEINRIFGVFSILIFFFCSYLQHYSADLIEVTLVLFVIKSTTNMLLLTYLQKWVVSEIIRIFFIQSFFVGFFVPYSSWFCIYYINVSIIRRRGGAGWNAGVCRFGEGIGARTGHSNCMQFSSFLVW